MALKKNKVKFGLNKVHYAKITAWSDEGEPTFATPVRLPGAVSLSIDANGENENFYADNSVYYVINNNAGYDGDLEVQSPQFLRSLAFRKIQSNPTASGTAFIPAIRPAEKSCTACNAMRKFRRIRTARQKSSAVTSAVSYGGLRIQI